MQPMIAEGVLHFLSLKSIPPIPCPRTRDGGFPQRPSAFDAPLMGEGFGLAAHPQPPNKPRCDSHNQR